MPTSKTICTPRQKRLLVTLVVAGIAVAVGVWWLLSPGRNSVTIGVEGRRLVTLPGLNLEAVPYTHGDPLAVRIASAVRVADGIRYDIRYMAYGPGEHNLADYLMDESGQQPRDLAEFTVAVEALLAENYSGVLFETAESPIDLHSRYRLFMALLWIGWGALIIPLVLYGRRTPKAIVEEAPAPSVPDRLRQLLETAENESLSVEQQADLEKLLLHFWAERLQVSSQRLIEMLDELRKDPAVGAQLTAVERWLHSRNETHVNGSIARELLVELGWHRGDVARGAVQS